MLRLRRDIAFLLTDEQEECVKTRKLLDETSVKYAVIPCAVMQEPILVAGERLYHGIDAIAQYVKSKPPYQKAV